MSERLRFVSSAVALAALSAFAPVGMAQVSPPDIGFVYPAGGRQGSTFELKLAGQHLDDALASQAAYVSVDATGCPGAGKFLRRISLTPAGLAPAHTA